MKVALLVLVVLILVAAAVIVGPVCLAYIINHVSPSLGRAIHVKPTDLPVAVGGIIFSEAVVPIAVIVWILVSLGVFK